MLAIALGYKSEDRTEDPVCLYCGHDAEKALAIAEALPEGIEVVRIIKNPAFSKQLHLAPLREGIEAAEKVVAEKAAAEKAAAEKVAAAKATPSKTSDKSSDKSR